VTLNPSNIHYDYNCDVKQIGMFDWKDTCARWLYLTLDAVSYIDCLSRKNSIYEIISWAGILVYSILRSKSKFVIIWGLQMHYIIKNQFRHCHHRSYVVIFKLLFLFYFNLLLREICKMVITWQWCVIYCEIIIIILIVGF
jgi:hypothetical protein